VAKPVDPQRLLIATYPYRATVETQFGDMDIAGHVNNVAIARFYENVRARFHLYMFGEDFYQSGSGYSGVIVESTIRYLAECNFPAPVEIGIAIAHAGNTSYLFQQALFQNGECIGLCDTAAVMLQHGKPTRIPDDVRARLQAMVPRREEMATA
jgi:acyl-CoA thioester hydrolase